MIIRAPAMRPVIFIAGPIQGADDWQSDAISILKKHGSGDFDIACPRRNEVTLGEFTTEMYHEQVDWEHHHLDCAAKCGAILFWLAKEAEHNCERSYAQTTRFELGEAVARHKSEGVRVVVGIEEGFSNARYIRYTLGKKYPNIPIYDTLQRTCFGALDALKAV